MALITDAALVWSTAIALSTDEIWQARKGSVFVSTAASPGPDDGLSLEEGNAVQLPAGASVSYRKAGAGEAWIAREAV